MITNREANRVKDYLNIASTLEPMERASRLVEDSPDNELLDKYIERRIEKLNEVSDV
ncbi:MULTISPECIES: hypothetical protein [unclassified Enterococcus]|uniref:hypothetical protein n=1 Tax=unclassified Enterococcus TaxID=2608891 RepID=UPI001554AFFB|nr:MULTISPECIES: hypothetical protein [unclassified Enterococcus]MBS7578318.1 hypothetical protein [Enterococcus sp. MMGLQ5-2]MBS7585471.1 hypothetical protein [Enterococcus sp. MMGLQ5-1]NPD13328.1 hypothetical protein [Enterococcus sp. MMGLQ5-1]NPD38149.1 hypothetical protein [Enterococcus sp. MMGLQ5-2]